MTDLNNNFRRVEGISNTSTGIVDTLGRLGTGSFFSQLKPASFAGIPFAVVSSATTAGRRNAVHEYPFRDTPWIEDLGRSGRRITIAGFLVGDDVIARREKLLLKVESKGEFTLVHPTLGSRAVSLIEFTCNESADRGRVFDIEFVFMEQGARQYPTTTTSSTSEVDRAADTAAAKSATDYAKEVYTSLVNGAAKANDAIKQATEYSKRARQVITDATQLIGLAASLPNQFGRLLGQSRGVLLESRPRPGVLAVTLRQLQGAGSASRQRGFAAAAAFDSASKVLAPSTAQAFAAAATALVQTVSASAPTPGAALLALLQLAQFNPIGTAPAPADPALAVRIATVTMLRRAAAVEMARIVSRYAPASADEARRVRDLVCNALDVAITAAGDSRRDDVFASLRALRTVVARQVNARGAQVPELQQVQTAVPMPSLVLAQRLYRDAGRADELVQRANPRHPAFMPTNFKAPSK